MQKNIKYMDQFGAKVNIGRICDVTSGTMGLAERVKIQECIYNYIVLKQNQGMLNH